MDREVLWKAHTHRDWPTPIGLCHQPVSSCNGSLQVAEERCKVERERERERDKERERERETMACGLPNKTTQDTHTSLVV